MRRIILFCSFLTLALVSGCQSAPEKRYPLQAEVISVDAPHGLMVVKHGEIAGLMPAMTMQYQVADPKQIGSLEPGDKIRAELVVSESKGRLEKITLVSKGDGKPSTGTSQHIPEKGELVPDFALTNQDGKPVHLDDYRGKTLLVTFIYTRCPLPDFCPRMNENFREIQKALREKPQSLAHVAFLSISFDPEHDTPAVLKHYAAIYRKSAPGDQGLDWQFAVPAARDLEALARFFGLVLEPEQAQIVHSLSTTLVGPDGRVEDWYEGNDWKSADVARAIELNRSHT